MNGIRRAVRLAEKAIAVGVGAMLFLSPGRAAAPHARPEAILLDSELAQLRTGDLIFRRGEGAVSRAVNVLDGESLYTHVGVILRKANRVVVVHAMPSDVEPGPDGTREEPVANFVRSDRAQAIAILRCERCTPEALIAVGRWAEKAARGKLPFDFGAEFHDGQKTYCTKLVWQAFMSAGVNLQVFLRPINLPLVQADVLFPSALMHSPKLQAVMTRQRPDVPGNTL